MIDPSSSEEEGDEDAVINLAHKGRIGAQNKSVTSSVSGPAPGSSSSSGVVIPSAPAGASSKTQNGDFSGNQRTSNANVGSGATNNEQPPQSLNEGTNLGIPSNGITRFV